MDTLGYIQNILGYENKKLGMIGNQFGTLMISSLGGFKLSEAIAPLTRKLNIYLLIITINLLVLHITLII